MMEQYKHHKIWELFNTEEEKKGFLNILQNQKFEKGNNFLELFPDELTESSENVILSLIKNIIQNEKQINSEDVQEDIFYIKLFQNKNKIFSKLLKFYKDHNIDKSKIINLTISFINESKEKTELEEACEFLNDKFIKKNEFFFKQNNIEILVPIYVLQKTVKNEKFVSLFLNILSEYIVDKETIFNENKNNKFLLLEKMIENNFFKEKYKNKTLSFIDTAIKNRDKYIHEKLIKIYNNYQKTIYNEQKKEKEHYYYSKIIKILKDGQKYDINDYLTKIGNNINYINSLKNIEKYLTYFYTEEKCEEKKKLDKLINHLEDRNINKKENENLRDDLKFFISNYKEKCDDIKYINSSIFNKILCSIIAKEKDENKFLEETKKKFNNFKKLFENKSIEEKLQDKEMCEILIIKEKNDLKKEIEELNNLLIIPKKSEEQIKTLIEEIITYNSYSLVKQIFGGLKIIFENLNIKDIISETISIYEDLNNINKKRSLDDIKKKIEYLSNLNINIKEDNNKLIKFLKFLFQFPNSLK